MNGIYYVFINFLIPFFDIGNALDYFGMDGSKLLLGLVRASKVLSVVVN